jgi:hypothetical protein
VLDVRVLSLFLVATSFLMPLPRTRFISPAMRFANTQTPNVSPASLRDFVHPSIRAAHARRQTKIVLMYVSA